MAAARMNPAPPTVVTTEIFAGPPHRASELVLDEIASRHGSAESAQRARGTSARSRNQDRNGGRVDGHHVDRRRQACPHEPRLLRNAIGTSMPSEYLEGPTLANGHELTRHTDGKLQRRDDQQPVSGPHERTLRHGPPRAIPLARRLSTIGVIIARSGILSDMHSLRALVARPMEEYSVRVWDAGGATCGT